MNTLRPCTTNTLLRNKEIKNLKASLVSSYNITLENLILLFPVKASVSKWKFAAPSRLVVFAVDDQPLFYDMHGKNENSSIFLPTVYALWKVPTLLDTLPIHPSVSSYILNGAHLMLPGLRENKKIVREYEVGSLKSVITIDNDMPFAVGTLCMSGEDAYSKTRGKLLEVGHQVYDGLWALGSKIVPEGFTPTEILTNGKQKSRGDDDDVVDTHKEKEEKAVLQEITSSPEMDMETRLEQAFLWALKTKTKKSELPLLTSTLFSTKMMACAPLDGNGDVLDLNIKSSKYKKFSIFCREMETRGVVTMTRKDGVEHITSFCTRNERMMKYAMPVVDTPTEKVRIVPEMIPLLKAPAGLNLILHETKCVQSHSGYWTVGEATAAVQEYIKSQKLKITSVGFELNAALTDALFYGLKKPTNGNYPTHLTNIELKELLEKACAAYTFLKVYKLEPGSILRGAVPRITVRVEKRTGTKFATVLSNLATYGINVADFAKDGAKEFACTATTQKTTPTSTDLQVVLQGHVVHQVESVLKQQYKIPHSRLNITFAKGASKKKKK